MHIDRGDGRVTLIFQQSAAQQATSGIYLLVMAGVACGLLFGCVYVIVVNPARVMQVVPLFLGCAALATVNLVSGLRDRDCATLFDLTTRTVTCMESGLISRTRGPVAFGEIVGLSTRVGFAQNHRSVIAELMLANGETWRLGYELIWLRPSSTSDIPHLVAKVRKATGLSGGHTE
jgi:hypothetical protein